MFQRRNLLVECPYAEAWNRQNKALVWEPGAEAGGRKADHPSCPLISHRTDFPGIGMQCNINLRPQCLSLVWYLL